MWRWESRFARRTLYPSKAKETIALFIVICNTFITRYTYKNKKREYIRTCIYEYQIVLYVG